MFRIGATQKLIKEMNINTEIMNQEVADLYSWHANLMRINRKKCIILMNDLTRYSIFLYGLRKKDIVDLSQLFMRSLENSLISEGIEKQIIKKYLDGQSITYIKTHNRSILSQINDIAYITEWVFEDVGIKDIVNIQEINHENNRIPMSPLRGRYPVEIMQEELLNL